VIDAARWAWQHRLRLDCKQQTAQAAAMIDWLIDYIVH
jgi:hypothetical protein